MLIILALLIAFVGNIAFFLWRQGRARAPLDDNPYAGLAYPIAGSIGALMFGALAVTAVSGFPVLAGLVPVALCLIDALLLLGRGIVAGLRLSVELGAKSAEFLLDAVIALSRQLSRLFAAIVGAIGDGVEARRRRAEARQANQEPTANLRHHVGIALVDANRSFWTLAGTTLRGGGSGVAGLARFGAGLLHDLLHTFAALLLVVAKLVAAVLLWIFYFLPRISWTLWNWVCRFDFAKRLHFEPLPDPPPKARLETRLGRLNLDVFGRVATVRSLREAPLPTLAEAESVERVAPSG